MLRAATFDDADAIARLHAESWRRTYRGLMRDAYLDDEVVDDRIGVWRERLANPDPRRMVEVAERVGTLAGFICVYGAEHPRWGSLIDNLHVSWDARREGIATLLMRDAARWLNAQYADLPLYLGVMEANTGARRFYQRLGAHEDAAEDTQVHGGGTAAVCRCRWNRPGALLRACSER